MTDVYINRMLTDDQGTIGILAVPSFEWSCFINELPDRNNERNFSRIPEGTYQVAYVDSKKHGGVYLVQNVPGRSAILMHSGNYAGDTRKNWRSDVLGCLEFGSRVVIMNNQRAVANSRSTRDIFQKLMNGETFNLIIS
jgi:hypothetical protein